MSNLLRLAAQIDTSPLPRPSSSTANDIKPVFDIVIAIFAATSVLMIVIGGLSYILANGEPAAVSKAKNTILYSAIGLVISMSAYLIVGLVIGSV